MISTRHVTPPAATRKQSRRHTHAGASTLFKGSRHKSRRRVVHVPIAAVLMQAAAEASIKAGCTNTESRAKSLAKVEARKRPTETCVETQDQSGAGTATTDGSASARAVRTALHTCMP